ncbi:MAG TPA: tetratricopeptide repeat protein [Gemmataceae bacterium]|nr:tetratricopeptide repeat protein [Gemmataceae bacterium]
MTRKRLAGGVCLVLFLAALGFGAWLWRHNRRQMPPVPEVLLSNEVDRSLVEAIAAARQAVLRQPNNASTWGRLGMLLLANGFAEQAGAFLQQAEKLQPNDPRWPYLQAVPLLVRDREAAVPYLRRAVELGELHHPSNPTPRLRLAEVYLEKGELESAEQLCRTALERQPDNPRAHFNLGVIALARNDLEASVTHLTRAAASPYARRKAYIQLAAVYQRRGDRALAETFSREAQQAKPDLIWEDPYAAGYQQLALGRQQDFLTAERLEQEGRLAEEAKILQTVAVEYPDDRSYVALGVALAKIGNYAAAEKVLRKALQQAPDKINAHFTLGVVLLRKGERQQQDGPADAAAALFRAAADSERRVLELKPDHAMAYLVLGMAVNHLGQKTQALDAFRAAVRCRPELANAHFQLGEALAANGQEAEAEIHLRHAVELAPAEDPRPREALDRLRKTHRP